MSANTGQTLIKVSVMCIVVIGGLTAALTMAIYRYLSLECIYIHIINHTSPPHLLYSNVIIHVSQNDPDAQEVKCSSRVSQPSSSVCQLNRVQYSDGQLHGHCLSLWPSPLLTLTFDRSSNIATWRGPHQLPTAHLHTSIAADALLTFVSSDILQSFNAQCFCQFGMCIYTL